MKEKSIKLNAILNSIRQMCTIVLPIIAFPYISRILQKENYGKISFCNSIISYFSLFAALGIYNYAVREGAGLRDDREKLAEFSSQIFSINIMTTVIAYVFLGILILFSSRLETYKILLFILSFGIGFTTLGIDWLYGIYEDYLYITIRSILIQVISLILMFAFVRYSEDYIKYAMITVLASGGGNIFNYIHAKKYVNLRVTTHVNVKKHIIPMLILFCNSLMISIYVNSDITILGIFSDDATVGIYSVAAKIYMLVKNLLNAIIVVTIPRLSYCLKMRNAEEYEKLSRKTLKILLIILFPAIVGLFMISRNVILIISGVEYVAAESALKILCVALGFSVVASFFTMSVLLSHKMEKKILIATIASSSLNLILNFMLIPLFGIDGAAFTTAIAECLVMLLSIIFSRHVFNFTGFRITFVSVLIGCIGLVVVCLVVDVFSLGLFADTILKIVLSAIVYGIFMLVCKNEIVLEQVKNIKRKIPWSAKK